MNTSSDPTTKHQIERMVNDLCSAFNGDFSRSQIEEVMNDSSERVIEIARVLDFVPWMAYRPTRERLNAIRRAKGHDSSGSCDVCRFVSLSGGDAARSERP